MRLGKIIILPVFAVLPLCMSLSPVHAAALKNGKTVMATVNGKKITANDITVRLWEAQGNQILNELIAERVLLDEAAKQKITVSDENINAFYERSLGGRSKQDAAKDLARIGLTEKDIKLRLKNQAIMNELIIKLGGISVSEDEISDAYSNGKDKLVKTETYNISQIIVPTKEEAGQIIDELLQNSKADFSEMSAARSADPGLRERRGLVGDVARGQLPQNIENELFSLRPGQLSRVMATGSGYSVFKINSISPARQLSLEEVKESLRTAILANKLNAKRGEVINSLVSQANIKIN